MLDLVPPPDLLVVDGYATLDPTGRPGLGARAAERFGVPVIGIAKTPFRAATHAREVRRGAATRPLHVTGAGGLGDEEAAQVVARMAGRYRLPDAVAHVDRLARGTRTPGAAQHPAVRAAQAPDRTA